MTSPTPDLHRLGADLERAAARNLTSSRRGLRVRRAGLAVVALTIVAAGTAVAAGLFSPKQVAAGMPASSVIFGNTHPTCVADADGVTFHCSLDVAPQSDITGMTPVSPRPGKPVGPVVPADYLGRLEPIAVDGIVAGGCIGRASDGLTWDCFMGQEAVTREIIGPDFLGVPMTEPGRG